MPSTRSHGKAAPALSELIGVSDMLTLADALVRCAHLVDHVFAAVAREQGLTPQHAQLLCLLTRGPLPMRELARLLSLEKSGITGLVDRVEQRGLVTRLADENDRRAWNIALTELGAQRATAAHADISVQLEALSAGLSAAQRATTLAAIESILDAHTGATGHPWRLTS